MKIRKSNDKPVMIRKQRRMKLHIRTGSKRLSGRTNKKQNHSSGADSCFSTNVRRHSLYTMGSIGLSKAADHAEGGEEIKESAGLTAYALSCVYGGAKGAGNIYRRKKQSEQAEKKTDDKNKADKAGLSQVLVKEKNGKRNPGLRQSGSRHKAKKGMGRSVRSAMLIAFLAGRRNGDESSRAGGTAFKDKIRAGVLILIKKIAASLLPAFLTLFSIISLVSIVVIVVMSIIYNSPLAIFFPLPDTGYENPRTVLASYYSDFDRNVTNIEENGENITYSNTENGAPVSNFNDTLMVYMVLYGDGDTGFIMDDDGRNNLKKVFDEMNYIESASSASEMDVGDSLGEVWVTAYCPCALCCGPYANGITASGKRARARHTIAVDAYNPIVPMGTKVVIGGVTYTVEDTGDLNSHENDFDIFYARHEDCDQWGRQKVEAYLAEGSTNKVMVVSSGSTVHNLTYTDYIERHGLTEEQQKMLAVMMSPEYAGSMYSGDRGFYALQAALAKVGCSYSQERRYEEGYYDCSSFVQRSYKEAGTDLPGVSYEQGRYCYENAMIINKSQLQEGDLIFYSYEENGQFRNISHVAIYAGEGMMVHAANPERGVVCDPLRDDNVVFYARPYR